MTDFEGLYRAYFTDVFRYLRRLTGDADLAEELTSETFFKTMQALDGFRGDCDIRVWLCQIAKNCYYTYCKKHNRLLPLEQKEERLPELSPSPEEALVDESDAMEIHRLLHALPEPYKEVFLLRCFGELSFKQIGTLFGKTENWACVTYHRARSKIKEEMEGKHHET